MQGIRQTEDPASQSAAAWKPPDVFGELTADGCSEVVIQLIEAFRSDTADRLQQLGVAFANRDYKRVRAEAHTIKGAAKQMGADSMASTCQDIESAQTETPLTEIGPRISMLEEQFAEVCQGLALYANHPLNQGDAGN